MEYVTNLPKEDPSVATTSVHGLSFTYPVQYYDFHVYYYARNPKSNNESNQLRDKLLKDFPEEAANGSILVKKLPDDRVIGPHITQFWEADVRRPEVFIKVLSWFQLHHGNLSVLIHPQTGDDVEDHTNRAFWLGDKLPLILDSFPPESDGGIPEFGVRGGARIKPEDFDSHKTVL
ncbi:dopa 4,5-dioxygenase family-domain-containing protein [Scheffersomyces xylosifermentans]|uniref:dopa 4,5-dioxygenase family-domain-containing protein n=1 Tax=Scheffersomyces xylosifermentans TaxID=1304137 RepID=UPI00315D62A4